ATRVGEPSPPDPARPEVAPPTIFLTLRTGVRRGPPPSVHGLNHGIGGRWTTLVVRRSAALVQTGLPARRNAPRRRSAGTADLFRPQELLGPRPHPQAYGTCIAAPWRHAPPADSPILTAAS